AGSARDQGAHPAGRRRAPRPARGADRGRVRRIALAWSLRSRVPRRVRQRGDAARDTQAEGDRGRAGRADARRAPGRGQSRPDAGGDAMRRGVAIGFASLLLVLLISSRPAAAQSNAGNPDSEGCWGGYQTQTPRSYVVKG